ncbi:Biotin/lipoate A/B protein ligase [Kalmanozyma brasiliensis GHG001]|uniref:Biotin/lipoate A/B protein ligase n=1 Tax=Kalmanozyma brasiliensis (strain GHG001) TaxID=1365824 RepID=UPI001CE9EA4C|nr:Biotin/lipoate A/B protein ligase [Kalmanozyma brasiliensis GHG001]EST08065.2 Biotin/lipoate A/B protein ligase [Kalmanozyma brasiliensis GHG001]
MSGSTLSTIFPNICTRAGGRRFLSTAVQPARPPEPPHRRVQLASCSFGRAQGQASAVWAARAIASAISAATPARGANPIASSSASGGIRLRSPFRCSSLSTASSRRSLGLAAMSDVLVYSGPGVSTSALHHTLKTLRTLLTTYDVKTADAKTLALDPWQKGAALVVIPGGRDLPYVSELARPYSRDTNASSSSGSRTASAQVRAYVESGGSFLGICAGAYYASAHCTFERGTSMEVDGERPFLRFFPGTCQGTVYPGFVYESDKGARIVDIERTRESDQWRCHYNGGGAFMDADRFAGDGVEVLARYAQVQPDELRLDIDLNSGEAKQRRPDYGGEAAVVLSSVGLGKALLFGTHPEFPLLPTSTPVLLAENGQTQAQDDKDRDEHDRQLRVHEQRRLQWMHELFSQRLGLRSELPQWAAPTKLSEAARAAGAASTAVETEEPKLQPILLASIGEGSDQVTNDIVQKLAAEASSSASHIEGFGSSSALKGAIVASVKDSNDTMHFASADANAIREAQGLCSSADYAAFSKPIVPAPAADGSAEDSNSDKEVDLDSVPKYVLVCKQDRPSSDVLPYWNIAEYEKHLLHFRQINSQRESDKEPGHWSTWRAPYDPFNPFGSSASTTPTDLRFGTPMLYTQMVTSTQTMLDKNFRLLSALPVGTTFFATQQMSGRGRGGNRWISPKGCLQFSTVFRVPVSMASKTVFLQYLSALAVVEGIRIALGDSAAGRAVADKVRIKWPNDIYAEIPPASDGRAKTATFELNGKRYAKLGGILVNSQFSGGSEFVLISGCGVNCLNPRPTTSVSDLIAIHNDTNEGEKLDEITQEKLAGAILSTFDSIWRTFMQNGGNFAPFVPRYRQAWLHSDQETTLTEDALRSGEGGGEESVRIVGISSDFGLLQAVPRTSNVHAKDGRAWGDTKDANASGIIQLQPDGNSFDMLQNLVKRKV